MSNFTTLFENWQRARQVLEEWQAKGRPATSVEIDAERLAAHELNRYLDPNAPRLAWVR